MKKWIERAAVGFGLGYSPIMPGTVGTLLGLPLAWGLMCLPLVWQPTVATLLVAAAVPLCGIAERRIGGKDPACIVADEYLTLPVTVIGLSSPWALLSGFLLHRLFDITKPPPIRQLQRIHGGTGIVLDDLLAALLALGCNHLLFRFVL